MSEQARAAVGGTVAGTGVPVAAGETPVKLAGGGTAWVVRLKRTAMTDIATRVGDGSGDAFSMQVAELVVRAAVVRLEHDGELRGDDGSAFEIKRRREGPLTLAQRELFDIIGGDDVAAIIAAASAGLSGSMAGK